MCHLGGASADVGAGHEEAEAAVPGEELLPAERARAAIRREEIARGIREPVASAVQNLRNHRQSHCVEKRGNVERREEIRELNDPGMRVFLEELDPIQGRGFRDLLPHAEESAIELLTQMLQFGLIRGHM